MTHSLPVPAAGWSPKHALTLTVTPSQALAICSSGNYGIRHLELWFIGIFFPPILLTLNAHRLSASPKPHGKESCGQQSSTWGLRISKKARCVPTQLLTPRCCLLLYIPSSPRCCGAAGPWLSP